MGEQERREAEAGGEAAAAAHSSSMQRVKVYRLSDGGKWDDQGTGHVTIDYIEGSKELGLTVLDEENNETLLIHNITSEDIYRKQEETIISWRDPEAATELALSFQEAAGCSCTWDDICDIQRNLQFCNLGALEVGPRPVSETLEASRVLHSNENEEISSQAESDSETENEENSSDEEIGEPEEQRIDLRTITADEYAILRHRNQFVLLRSSTNPKFHTSFQELVYEQMYGPHRQFADHKFVNWPHLNSLDKYEGTYRLFQRAGILDLVALRCDYDEEIIRQFYATLYVSPDFSQIAWMTGTTYLDCQRHEFELALRTESSSYEKVYERPALLVPAWTEYYDQNVRYVPGKIGGLLPIPSLVNRIINHTILPKSGNFDAIRGHVWNLIDNIMHGRKFDVVDVIIREIASSKNDRVKRINYAPYIMALIIRKTGYRGGLGSVHKPYKPREGPPIPTDVRLQVQQREQRADAQREDAPRAAAQEEGQVSFAQIYSAILEIKNTQQEIKNSQQEFQSETNNRLIALSKSVSALEQVLTVPARYGRRHPHAPHRDPLPASTSQAPPPPQDQAPPPSQDQVD